MHPYAGDPTNFPLTVDILDDSDPPNSLTFNPANEGALDRTAYLQARLDPITLSDLQDINTTTLANGTVRYVGSYGFYVFNSASSQLDDEPGCVAPVTGPGRWFQQNPFQNDHAFMADTTWIVPATGFYLIQGCGGGGGGGGSQVGAGASGPGQGGGGGAGANLVSRVVFLNQGASCAIVVGPGGTFGGIGQDGNEGVDSSFTCGGISIVMEGGGPGGKGTNYDWLSLGGGPVPGGNPSRRAAVGPRLEVASIGLPFLPAGAPPWFPIGPGFGGYTDSFYRTGIANSSSAGTRSCTGFAGGAKGTEGAASPVHGGQGGGGGGGGPFGVGAAGGAGGVGGGGGAGGNGVIGADAGNNTGAGGGGAGAPGAGASSGLARHGGSGGSGLIYIVGLS